MKKGLNLSLFSNFSNIKEVEKSSKTEDNNKIITSVLKRILLSSSEQSELKDLINEIKSKKGTISDEGIVTCYYALSKYNNKKFEKSGKVGAGSDKIMVSTKNSKDLKKYGDTILTLYIPIERLYFTANTKEEVLLKMPFRSSKREIDIKQFQK